MGTVVVAGALANKPGNGGEAWVRLSWVLGLKRLGFDPWFVEQIDPAVCVDATGARAPLERSVNLGWFDAVTRDYGLADRSALLDTAGNVHRPLQAVELLDAVTGADLLLNISGNLSDEALFAAPRARAYLDLDPGYTQIWHRAGVLKTRLERHEHHLTVGLSVGRRPSAIPTGAIRWRPVLPPVLLDEWPASAVGDGAELESPRFTTVGSWRGGYGRLEWGGHLYGQKAHEFRRLADFPKRVPDVRFEAALAIDDADSDDAIRLAAGGWVLRAPGAVASTPEDFRRYVQSSTAELSPAQGVYVDTRSGWFSDRTARYLASGRPAVVQDTGVPADVPLGEGLLTFTTPDDATDAVEAVLTNYDRHARAARLFAERLLDSDVVIGRVLEDLLP
jgi:hypothetical protein